MFTLFQQYFISLKFFFIFAAVFRFLTVCFCEIANVVVNMKA